VKKDKKIKIHHLIRYFLVLAVVSTMGYINHWQDNVFLFLVGPVLYLCVPLRNFVESIFGSIPFSQTINQFGFILPVLLVYYGLIGFQLKQLWNEQGLIRIVSLMALIGFLAYIHYKSWTNLTAFMTPII
jgi:hypothetical protein